MKENWKYKKLGEIATFTSGSRPAGGVGNINEGVLSLGGEHIGRNGHIDLSSPKYVTYDYYNENKKGHIVENDILLCKDGALTGKVAILRGELSSTCSMVNEHVFILRAKSILQWYLFYFLYSHIGQLQLKVRIKGAAQGGLNGTNLKTISIPVPPLPVQRQIVAELDLLSDIIEKQKQQIAELDKLAQATFYDMFGDPVTNEKGWEVKRLKDCVIEMFLGPFGSALKTDSYVDKNNAYCMIYEQKHAIRKTLDVETHYIDKKKHDSLKRFEVHSGDFIMSCRGTIGEIFRLPNEAPMGIIHPSLMKIRIKEDIFNSTFFLWLLSWIIKNENTNGNCVQMAITAKELGTRTPIVPPLQLQQSFASKIEAIERQKELISNSIKESQKLFDSRMEYWFG